jgi:hypothetical protein
VEKRDEHDPDELRRLAKRRGPRGVARALEEQEQRPRVMGVYDDDPQSSA